MIRQDIKETLKECAVLCQTKSTYDAAYNRLTSALSLPVAGKNFSTPKDKIHSEELAARSKATDRGPLVSLIIVTKNSEHFLRRALKSVKSQEYQYVEIIVQDGGSTDKTINIIEEEGLKENLCVEEDKATLDGLLRAVKRAKGEIIGVCWSDDELFPHATGWAVNALTDESIDIVYGDQLTIDTTQNYTFITYGSPWDLKKFIKHEFYPPFSSSFFRRKTLLSLADTLTEFDHDEYEFWLWLGLFNIQYQPGLISKFYRHSNTRWIQPGYAEAMLTGKRRAFTHFFNPRSC